MLALVLSALVVLGSQSTLASKFYLNLGGMTPQETGTDYTVQWAREDNFASGSDLSVSLDTLTGPAGQVRVPHWHAATELHYLLEGEARVTSIFNGYEETFIMQPGDVFLTPEGYYHHFEKTTDEPLVMVNLFNTGELDTFDITEAWGMLRALNPTILAKTFDISEEKVMALRAHGPGETKDQFRNPRPDYEYKKKELTSRNRCFFLPNLDDREKPKNKYYPMSYVYFATQPWFDHMEDSSFVHIRLEPGAMREPQWMNIGSELMFVTQGSVEFGVVGKTSDPSEKNQVPKYGIGWTPHGFTSYIYNNGDEPAEVLLMYGFGAPEYTSLREAYTKTPREILSTIHDYPVEGFADFKGLDRTPNAETFTAEKEGCPKNTKQKLRQIG